MYINPTGDAQTDLMSSYY